MMLSLVLHLSQQLSGMAGVRIMRQNYVKFALTIAIHTCPSLQVLFYSTEIFAAAGVPYSEVATIVVGITLLSFTIVTVSL